MFVDEINIRTIGGKGGNGCVSFRREKYLEFGGPDGGSGGKGGDVIIRADKNLTTLLDLLNLSTLKAKDGEGGKGSRKTGKMGDNLVVRVPIGTQVFEDGQMLCDLVNHGQEFIVAYGGKGGAGNAVFKSSTNQVPTKAIQGELGEDKYISLELKIFCDVGLVGFPNAGKSSMLAALTRAKPKIADYPFTTLTPNVGVVQVGNYDQFVIGDIPGLIEGASEGRGLGDRFLKHVERCKVLCHLVSCENEDMLESYFKIRQELEDYDEMFEEYNTGLAEKPEFVVITKVDLLAPAKLTKHCNKLVKYLSKQKIPYISVSTFDKEALEEIKKIQYKMIKDFQSKYE